MRTLGSSASESSTPDNMVATAAAIFTEQSSWVSKCKRLEQKYSTVLEQKVTWVCVCVGGGVSVRGGGYLINRVCVYGRTCQGYYQPSLRLFVFVTSVQGRRVW